MKRTIRRQPTVDLLSLQERVNVIFNRLGCALSVVTVEISKEDNILATAQGVKFHIPFGKIKISQKLLEFLNYEEIEFVLAHESAHIFLNHMVGTGSFVVARALAEDAARNDSNLKGLLVLWDNLKLLSFTAGKLPPLASLTKDQELDADAWAVFVTRNKKAARSALLKLSGNDLSSASHTWEVLEMKIPVMSMRERLSALDNRYTEK